MSEPTYRLFRPKYTVNGETGTQKLTTLAQPIAQAGGLGWSPVEKVAAPAVGRTLRKQPEMKANPRRMT